MNEIETPPWIARGWVGRPEVIDPFKLELEAQFGGDSIGIVNPPIGTLADWTDEDEQIVGFAVAARPDFAIAKPAGSFGVRRHVAEALLATLSTGRAV